MRKFVGNVEEGKDEDGTREYHTRREGEEGTSRPGCRSKSGHMLIVTEKKNAPGARLASLTWPLLLPGMTDDVRDVLAVLCALGHIPGRAGATAMFGL